MATPTARPPFCLTQGMTEMNELRATFSRNAATLPRDFAGVAALAVIAFVGLSAPGLF
ncbi:hypothetical protein C8D95_103465 [Silicimonas algicola]|uniref:Uncharacterized protein n=1 Tax=Silicimonas algicola TaxID=1826607 RepID=A0A316GB34_9RHOB|nr:hypothetical protein C8D95_103465 [Silicimonas algicola]